MLSRLSVTFLCLLQDYSKRDEEEDMLEVKEVKPTLTDHAADHDQVDMATVAVEQLGNTGKENGLDNSSFTAL